MSKPEALFFPVEIPDVERPGGAQTNSGVPEDREHYMSSAGVGEPFDTIEDLLSPTTNPDGVELLYVFFGVLDFTGSVLDITSA